MSHSNVEKIRSHSKDKSKSDSYKGKSKKHKGKKKPQSSSLHLNNAEKKNKTFMYQNLTRAKCYNCDFTNSNFDYVCFRGASIKSSKFYGATFKGAEFVGSNLKESTFSHVAFEDVLFEGVKLKDANFKGATFKNVIFLMTDASEAKHLDLAQDGITVYKEMPKVEMSDDLKAVIESAMMNKFIKKSRVLDTREGTINTLSIMKLLDLFDEKEIISGLKQSDEIIDRDFYTLSFLINLIEKAKS